MGIGGEDDASPGRAQPGNEIGRILDQSRVNAGEFRGFGIAAHRFEKQSQRGASDQQPQGAEYRSTQEEPRGNEPDVANAQVLQQRTGEARVGAAVEQIDHQAYAAARHHEDQRRDDGLDVEDGNQETVPKPAHDAGRQRQQQDDEMGIACMDAPGDDRAADGDHRAYREVDALGADHHSHSKRHHRRRHRPVQYVDQAAEQTAFDDADGEEAGRHETVHGKNERQDEQGPNRPVAGKHANPCVEGHSRRDG